MKHESVSLRAKLLAPLWRVLPVSALLELSGPKFLRDVGVSPLCGKCPFALVGEPDGLSFGRYLIIALYFIERAAVDMKLLGLPVKG